MFKNREFGKVVDFFENLEWKVYVLYCFGWYEEVVEFYVW